jgi:hypothetical protein
MAISLPARAAAEWWQSWCATIETPSGKVVLPAATVDRMLPALRRNMTDCLKFCP